MRNQFLCAGLVLAVALLLGGGLRADDKKADDKKKAEPSLEDYAKMSQPGPEHKKLDPLAGSWTFTAKMWMDPSKPPSESKGTSENKWIMDGRYLSQDVQGEMMGMKFAGHGLTGFDKAQGKYFGLWVDNFGTGYSTSTGTGDQTGKVFTFIREEIDPVTKQKSKGKDVIRIESNDKYVMEMYKDEGGKEIKMMEIVSTRKK